MIDISSIAARFIKKEKEKKAPTSQSNNDNNNDGNVQPSEPSLSTNNKNALNRNSFKFLYVIGKGGFGKVWKIQSKKTKIIYALKEMSKLKIIDKKSEKSINSEREFLSKLNHPFIVNMHYAFQDNDNLYLVMDILNGGDLRYHISRYRKFSEEQTRFFIANIIYGLQYIHSNNVIHRDIKPENLVLDENGYVRITDFGIAKENMEDNSSETSGTPGYMAPEVMKAKNHSFSVDFFAVGVIGYEFMLGKRPYYGKNRKEIKEQMLAKQVAITEETIAHGWSSESMDFINLLLQRKPTSRLGSKDGPRGAEELMKHLWLKYYPWNELKTKTLSAPFIPEPNDNFDRCYCEGVDKISEETQLRYEEIYSSSHFKKVFLKFYYNEDDPEEKERKEKIEKKRIEKIERELQKEMQEELEMEQEKEKEKQLLEKENQKKEINSPSKNKNENLEINTKLNNLNNQSTANFYRINKNNNNKIIINQRKIPNPSNENASNKKIALEKSKKANSLNKIKTLSYSNSTRDIYFEKPNYKCINNNNYNSNGQNNKKKIQQIPINDANFSQNNKKYSQNTNYIFNQQFQKGGNATNININNFYYTNNIISSINNNYMNNNVNKNNHNGVVRKFISQRSSSVISSKKNNQKMDKNNILINNKGNYKSIYKYKNNNFMIQNNIPKRKINRINGNFLKSPSNNIHKIIPNTISEKNE